MDRGCHNRHAWWVTLRPTEINAYGKKIHKTLSLINVKKIVQVIVYLKSILKMGIPNLDKCLEKVAES